MELDLFILLVYVTVLPVVSGCGQLQPGRERTINFAVTNFNLPAAIVYYDDPMAKMKEPTISTSKSEAQTVVRRLINQSVEVVFYEQGRSALLPDNVISSILQQLEVQTAYEPLECKNVVTQPDMAQNGGMEKILNCVIVGGTVTNTCVYAGPGADMCRLPANMMNFKPIEQKYLTISGSLKTSNVIMANWSNQMWESVLNRVLRKISSGPNGSFFYGASLRLS